jgi:DNA helicase HerA-like ATPase
MTDRFPCEPCDPDLYLGSLTQVRPDRYLMNLPHGHQSGFRQLGSRRFVGGRVGDMVVIDGGREHAVVRITEVRLPERDRDVVEVGRARDVHEARPIATLQPLATLSVAQQRVLPGVALPPVIGSRVYLAADQLVAWITQRAVLSESPSSEDPRPRVLLGTLSDAPSSGAEFAADDLLGHHLAVLGATGGGKSWTLARVVEELGDTKARVILMDATGEHHRLTCDAHLALGGDGPSGVDPVDFPHVEMRESSIFSLFTPSPQSQAPILREAIKSLKLAAALESSGESEDFLQDGVILKANRPKAPFTTAQRRHARQIYADVAPFDITRLVDQLREDCVYVNAFDGDGSKFGGYDKGSMGYVTFLVYRIEALLGDTRFSPVLAASRPSLVKAVFDFLTTDDSNALRIDLSALSYERNLREIVADAMVRRLLDYARQNPFLDRPLVLVVDEAHNYLQDLPYLAEAGLRLDALEAVAKEGRKYGLYMCLGTQRPRDLTASVASQMGSLVVHRLTDEHDLSAVRSGLAGLEGEAAAYIPELRQGEAVVLGTSSIFPMRVRVTPPSARPDSRGGVF